MRGGRTSTKRLLALLLTLLCVAARFQCIVCPSGGGRGGGGEGGGEAEGGGGGGAGTGEGEEGGEGAGGSRSGDEEEGGSTYSYSSWGGAAAAGPGVNPNAAAGWLGISLLILSGAAGASMVLVLMVCARICSRHRRSKQWTRSAGASHHV